MSTTAERSQILELRPSQLTPWPGLNPREHFSEERIRELAASIADKGVLQNLVVQDLGGDAYHIISGETRWRGAVLAERGCPEINLEGGREVHILCRVVRFTEAEALAIAMLENLQRGSLTAIEEARGFQRLLYLNPSWTQGRLAEEMLGDHKRQAYVSQRLNLLELPAGVQEWVQRDWIKASHARDLLLPLLRLPEDQAGPAMERTVAAVQAEINRGTVVQGPWLTETVARIRAEVEEEYGPKELFGPPAAPEPAFSEGMSCVHGVSTGAHCSACAPAPAPESWPEVEDSADANDAIDSMLHFSLATGTAALKAWADHAEAGASDSRILRDIRGRHNTLTKEVIQVAGAGAFQVDRRPDPCITMFTPVDGITRQFRGAQLTARARRLFAVPYPEGELGVDAGSADEGAAARYRDWEIERGYDRGGSPIPDAVEAVRLAAREAGHPMVEAPFLPAPAPEEAATVDRFEDADPFAAPTLPAAPAAELVDPTAAAPEAPAVRRCRICGCTEETPCDEGCFWIPDPSGSGDVCSARACMDAVHAEVPAAAEGHSETAAPTAPAATPAPESPAPPVAKVAAVKPAPAPPPQAQAAPAAPAAVLQLPDAGRQKVPEGAGLVETVLISTGGRPCTIAVIPGVNGVTVTVAPRIAKAKETPLLINAPTAEEVDARLLAAIDAHFK